MSEFDLWQRRCDAALEALHQAVKDRDEAVTQIARVVTICDNSTTGLISRDMILLALSAKAE